MELFKNLKEIDIKKTRHTRSKCPSSSPYLYQFKQKLNITYIHNCFNQNSNKFRLNNFI